jgi:hypothetical protein
MVPRWPVTPEPAVTGPFTGGQYVAHDPLQFDLVEVSGTNEYSVKPLASVSTVVPPIFAVVRAAADEPVLADDVAAADGVLEPAEPPVDVLPHAAAISATAAKPVDTHHLLRIASSPFTTIEHLPRSRSARPVRSRRIADAQAEPLMRTGIRGPFPCPGPLRRIRGPFPRPGPLPRIRGPFPVFPA